MKREKSNGDWSQAARQKVNISKKTVMKAANEKLSTALMHKLAYNKSGKMGVQSSVGQLFTAKA